MQAALQPERPFGRRTGTAISVVLAVLTGLALSQLGMLVMQRAPTGTAEFGTPQPLLIVAQEFYIGLNGVLRTGDPSQETRVAPGFVDHLPDGQGNRSWSGTVDALRDLRAVWPNVQFEVTALDPIGTRGLLKVALAVDAGHPAPIPGVPLSVPDPVSTVEYLEIEAGAVTARWNAEPAVAATTNRLDARIGWNNPLTVMAAIEHVLLAPNGTVELRVDQPIMLYVESGRVQFDRPTVDLDHSGVPAGTPVEPGETRVASGGGPLEVRNSGNDSAELWLFDAAASLVSDDNVDALAVMPLNFSSSAMDGLTSRLSAIRLTLPPGASVDAHLPGRMQEIAVLDGAIDVTVENGRALVCNGLVTTRTFDGTLRIDAGKGVSAKGNTTLSYRATSSQPATLLIFTIDPV